MLPLWVFRRRLLVTSGVVSAGAGAVLLGLSSYIPTYAQEVIGVGPLVAGLALAALTLGWPIAASQSGRIYLRFGFRACALVGSSLIVLGCALLLLLGGDTSVWQVGVTSMVIGLGMGLTVSPTLIAVAVQCRLEGPRRGHRQQPVPALGRQFAGHRGVRRRGQREAARIAGRSG